MIYFRAFKQLLAEKDTFSKYILGRMSSLRSPVDVVIWAQEHFRFLGLNERFLLKMNFYKR